MANCDSDKSGGSGPEVLTGSARVLGLLVFAGGIALMLIVFSWGYRLLADVDQQLAQVRPAPPVENLAAEEFPAAPTPPAVAEAAPQQGPTLAVVLAGIGVRLVIMLVLAGVGGMVAGRGAQLAGLRLS